MTDHVGRPIGNYRLLKWLGSGGFAEVYLGEHIHLGTRAAIKLLHTRVAQNNIAQFLQEGRMLAKLDHPAIVRILDFGIDDDGHSAYLIMNYAPGGTLRSRHPKGTQLPLPTVVEYVKQISQALQYAHDQRLVHRDVKPENMLIGRNGKILLSDFGIALIAQSSHYESTKDSAGTIAYMAPEQIKAHPRFASDQYSLAIVAYEWLVGKRPFQGNLEEIAIQHRVVPPPSLVEQLPSLPLAVEQVIFRALAKKTEERFNSVTAFATALEQASQPHQQASQPHQSVPNPTPSPTRSTRPVPEETTQKLPPPMPPGTTLFTYRSHSDCVRSVAWSPNGKWLASAGDDCTVQVWDAHTGYNPLPTSLRHAGLVWSVAWSPDSKQLASASDDCTVQVWDISTGGSLLLTYKGHADFVRSVAWSPDGQRLASASYDGTVQVWNVSQGNSPPLIYLGHADVVRSVAWSPDGRWLASASGDAVLVWDASTGSGPLLTYPGHSDWVASVAWSPDGQRLASASYDRTVQVWNPYTEGRLLLTYHVHEGFVQSVAWSPDGKWLASASDDWTIHVWDASRGPVWKSSLEGYRPQLLYRGHADVVWSVTWSPDGQWLASASDGSVQVWQG